MVTEWVPRAFKSTIVHPTKMLLFEEPGILDTREHEFNAWTAKSEYIRATGKKGRTGAN